MIINFSRKLYTLKSIENSIKAYEGLALFIIKKNKNNIKIKITDINEDIKDVFEDEFYNYVLSEMKSQQ